MKNVEGTSKSRLLYLDMLRTIACLSVVMIHVSAEFVVRGKTGPDFWLGNLFDSVSRAAVPLFVMISGALMLDENYEFTRRKWLGHIGRMIAFYVVWAITYFLLFNAPWDNPVPITNALGQIVSGHYHLWFVPLIIGLYLIVPLLRAWVSEKNVRIVEYFLLLSAFLTFLIPQCVDMLSYAFGWVGAFETPLDNMHLRYTAEYTAYFILGWYLNRGIVRKKLVCALGIVGVCLTFAGTAFVTISLRGKGYPFYENNTINVLLYSAAIFTLCRSLFGPEHRPGRLLQITAGGISKYSLGIYAVHVYIISHLMPLFGQLHAAAAIPLIFVLTVVLSAAVSMILSKIPLVKKIV